MDKDQWNECSTPFKLQPQLSVDSCGFGDFYNTSGKCTLLQLGTMDPEVTKQCSLFGISSFDDACGSCTHAMRTEVGKLVDDFDIKGSNTEKALCLVAVIVSVIATKTQNSSSIGDFDRCLPSLLTAG